MNRRTLLKSVGGAGAAGLLGIVGYRQMGRRQVTVARQDSTPVEIPVELDAKMVDKVATNGDAARVEVTITNPTSERVTDIIAGWPGVFTVTHSEQSAPGLQLVAAERDLMPVRHPLCPIPVANNAIPALGIEIDLPPGGTDSSAFEVWGQRDNDVGNCIPSGTYRFTNEYPTNPDTWDEFEWGFTLRVA